MLLFRVFSLAVGAPDRRGRRPAWSSSGDASVASAFKRYVGRWWRWDGGFGSRISGVFLKRHFVEGRREARNCCLNLSNHLQAKVRRLSPEGATGAALKTPRPVDQRVMLKQQGGVGHFLRSGRVRVPFRQASSRSCAAVDDAENNLVHPDSRRPVRRSASRCFRRSLHNSGDRQTPDIEMRLPSMSRSR